MTDGQAPTFPAIDPEPPPRSRREVALIVGGIVAVAAIIGVVGWVIVAGFGRGAPAAAPTTGPPRLALPGRLVVFDTTTGRLGAARPDGSGFAPFAGPAFPANLAVASPDGRHVVVGGTQVVDLGATGATARPTPLSSGDGAAVPQPFADHGSRVVLGSTSPGNPSGIVTVDLDGGSRHSLGSDAGNAAGDPTRDGAVVAVQGGTEVNLGPYTERDTSRVELRAWHRPTTTLATMAGLLKDAGLPGGSPYVVSPTVSPDGRFVALSIDELTPNPNSVTATHAIVVLDRSGRAVTTRGSFTSIAPSWSSDSAQLAYLDGQGVVLIRFTGDHAVTSSIAGQVSGGPCLFSPKSDHLLCDDRTTSQRFIVTLSNGQVDELAYDPTHLAVAWLPATGGGAG